MLRHDSVVFLADTFRLLGDGSRLAILFTCAGAPLNVGAIAAATGLSASLVSHHLRLLRAARIVRSDRRGRNVYYALADDHVARMLADMTAHVGEDDEASA
ncbi:MAG: ArsR/SmtB family transcription factor [Alphaproteobacteria bacterium]